MLQCVVMNVWLYLSYALYRVKAYIQYVRADTLVDPDNNDEGYGAPESDEFVDIIVPCPKRALHDHLYSREPDGDTTDSSQEAARPSRTPAIFPLDHDEIKQKCVIVKEGLQVSSHLRWQIEEGTR